MMNSLNTFYSNIPFENFTLVTPIIVRTSPLLIGKSWSAVPGKLYLATHSVPGGQIV